MTYYLLLRDFICLKTVNLKSYSPIFVLYYLRAMLKILLFIGSGSFLGGIARYLLSKAIQNSVLTTFPLGTFWVNIIGSFLIGMIYGLSDRGSLDSNELRLFLAVGFCGGFTTFSTFSNENLALLRDGSFFYFSLYAGMSVFIGLLATFGGNAVTKFF